MEQKQTRDFLIRNMPLEVHRLLEKAAKEHHRSKTEEAIVAISNGLSLLNYKLKKPTPFKWNQEISNAFIEKAIDAGRE